MRILIELGHPAHFHFFKYTIKELERNSHEIALVFREKDIINDLINKYNIKNIFCLKKADSIFRKLMSLFFSTKDLFKIALKFRPDLFLGWNAVYSGLVSKILRKPFILFEDNEYTWSQLILRIPFATKIFTNSTFPQKLGKNHYTYNSYEELAYLHPNWFQVNSNILNKYGLDKKGILIVIRIISWNATHDYTKSGFNFKNVKQEANFIRKLQKYGIILLSKEGFRPILLTKNKNIEISPLDFHDFLGIADLYIGEGGTCAAEAAILGIPTIYTSTLIRSYLKDISEKYDLIHFTNNNEDLFKKVESILKNPENKLKYKIRSNNLLNEKADLTKIILSILEHFNC